MEQLSNKDIINLLSMIKGYKALITLYSNDLPLSNDAIEVIMELESKLKNLNNNA